MKHTRLIEQLKAARAALSAAIRAAEAEAVKDEPDWKARCKVVKRLEEGWDVVSPDWLYWWAAPTQTWIKRDGVDKAFGLFFAKSDARTALAACTVPPPGENNP